ncbi:MAG TPA: alpha/beta hydrolase [Acidimicrobiales bacterium]|nr:alpha/beta hydrolase [Acidimicrobiales bacterium]
MSAPAILRHGAVDLALHPLKQGPGRPLLLLHGLGEASPTTLPARYASWPGPVHGLDFTGHGSSTVPAGGGYSAETLMGDADAAIAHLGEVTIVGRGLGAYIGLLVAGARPEQVRGAVLADGPGMAGGGSTPASPALHWVDPDAPAPPDPWALVELTCDPRPPDYAATFLRQAVMFSGLDEPVLVSAAGRPPWVEAVLAEPGVRAVPLAEALSLLASV